VSKIKLGLMGFGRIGRQIYGLAQASEQFEVTAISDIGQPQILCHLLNKTLGKNSDIKLEANHLVSAQGRSRLMPTDRPAEIPWDAFGVDIVIDATAKFRTRESLDPHIQNGAGRVITSVLPEDPLDRVVLYGVNEQSATAKDQIISAGSASTTAAALAIRTVNRAFDLNHASMTSVHAYTSDQSLQDYAGEDYRRSRSGAENIIPNNTPALAWLQTLLPEMNSRLTGYALNVPVQTGSMIDLTMSLQDSIDDINVLKALFLEAAEQRPDLVATTNDPIVSSDVRGSAVSLLVDLKGSMLAGKHIFKLIGWHETLGHAKRILDVANLYHELDRQVGAG
jgi:glyceraldehyde 3-phosphate dehydrogenase